MTARRPVLGSAGTLLLLLLLLVALGVGLLYAYRAQSPTREVPLGDAVARVERGDVSRVTISGVRAALELRDGHQRIETVIPDRDETLARSVSQRNQADPAHLVELRYEQPPSILPIGPLALSVLLSLLPLLLLVALVLLLASSLSMRRASDRYEQLARLADLRDRGAITEEEFQREKQRVLR